MSIINLTPLRFEHKPLFDQYFAVRRYENAHFNFTNLYMWREMFRVAWAEEDGVLYVFAAHNGILSACQPFCDDALLPQAIGRQLEHFRAVGASPLVTGLEREAAEVYAAYIGANGERFYLESDRADSDYVYRAEDIAALSGRRFHQKKNHFNAFRRENPRYEFRPIDEATIPLCKGELEEWFARHIAAEDIEGADYLRSEHKAILEVFDNFSAFKLTGGAILTGGRVVAFSFGERLNEDTAVIHVEKADPSVRGAYVAITTEFTRYLREQWGGRLLFVNREEDMGLDGLRQAKESWHPDHLTEKFVAKLK